MIKEDSFKISAILPVYNGEKFLKEALDSILNQTFGDFELVIVDDCSKDGSMNIIKNYKDKRIRVLKNKKNLGSIATINRAIENSKGKYIAVCTQDDVFHPKRFEIEYNYLEKHPEIFLVGSSAVYIDENGKELKRFGKYEDSKLLAWRLRKCCGIIFPSVIFRNKGKRDVYLGDHYEYDLYYRLLKRGENLINIPPFLVKYRFHPNSESVFDKERQHKLSEEVVQEFKKLKYSLNIFDKIYYTFKLGIHFLNTVHEKRIFKL